MYGESDSRTLAFVVDSCSPALFFVPVSEPSFHPEPITYLFSVQNLGYYSRIEKEKEKCAQ